VPAPYPSLPGDRDRWILARRGRKNRLEAGHPYACLVENERGASGEIVSTATVFLTNRECPWHCVYCDLWRNTLDESVPPGAIPAQLDFALDRLSPSKPRQIKLYNSGSFFDPRAIPPEDYPAIANRLRDFERTIVECHPALVGERLLRFRDLLPTGAILEVALGLETVHHTALEQLNKRMTLDDFARAADFLHRHGMPLRAFILVKPPFITDESEALVWAKNSLDFAAQQRTTVAVLIPTRGGHGALDALSREGLFAPPKLATLETAAAYGVGLRTLRVFADTWDLERFGDCPHCFSARKERLESMNLRQEIPPPIECPRCLTNSGR
jgi:archaeosine synthase beta-subunit